MGNTHEICVWTRPDEDSEFEYVEYYIGESFIVALFKFIQAKRQGYGCVQWEYR